MVETLNSILLTISDPLLSWLLDLPRDVALFIVALGTALILTVVRVFTTNQNLLERCKKDKVRLKQLMREAKESGDRETVRRCRATIGQIGMITLRAEGKPLLASLVPIAILACWCWARISFMPLAAEEPIVVRAYFPVSEIGKLVHITPQQGVEVDGHWIRAIERDVDKEGNDVDNGVAHWKLCCQQSDEQYALQIRYDGKIFEKNLIVDGRRYAEPIKFHEDDMVLCSEIEMADREYHPLNIIPGVPWAFLPPWIVGYLVIVLPLSFLLKPTLPHSLAPGYLLCPAV